MLKLQHPHLHDNLVRQEELFDSAVDERDLYSAAKKSKAWPCATLHELRMEVSETLHIVRRRRTAPGEGEEIGQLLRHAIGFGEAGEEGVHIDFFADALRHLLIASETAAVDEVAFHTDGIEGLFLGQIARKSRDIGIRDLEDIADRSLDFDIAQAAP